MEDDEEETEIIMSFLIFLNGIKELSMNDNDKRAQDRAIWMRSLCHEPTCISQLRLNTKTFSKLCNILYDEGGLVATKNVTIQEIVALFLHILGHDQKNSTIKTTFVRSGKTISRQFHTVLRAVLKIGKLFVKQQRDGIYLERDAERWKWFPNAIGALDGTFVDLTVPAEVKSKYRNRKGALSTNVLGVCDANLKFLYVLPGWEGSASDARVLCDALQRPNCLKVCREMSMNNKMKSGATTSANKARFMLPDKRAWGGTSSNSDTSAGAHFEALKNKKQSYVSWNKEMDSHLAKSHPDAKGLHNKTIDNWDDIVLLCGKDRATGQGAENFEDGAEAMGEEEENEVNSAPTMQPRVRPSSSTDSMLNKRKKLKNDSLAKVVGVIATSFQEFVASKKKKEEKPSGIEIHEVVSKIPGLTSNEIFTVVRKLMNGDVEEYKFVERSSGREKKRLGEFSYQFLNLS
ncbi:hypothetical protein BUALT_Bualt12G0097300 [Buddleja alternifolia]|uniref:DDE Tnp4 domain-containing protein n=1 Tax=Buddleja alternifolia TaxID=168488 RepID=A0AAV6WNY9_9LAMI|nr:hypothetical protein BUALT_Bualt12G0097300 [Buddleja alternifolia]